MFKKQYLDTLDAALAYAARHTDRDGRMVVNGEIDTKDSGWLVLGGTVRGIGVGWQLSEFDLKELCRKWCLASVRVDDKRSAWTTFAILLCFEFAGGEFAKIFSSGELAEIRNFINQIDMRFLLEASRNYRVAAAVIDILRVRHKFTDAPAVDPEECIDYMLAGYLGCGFFNDDDGRGDRNDRRTDAYSAEIIGLLLHYDEIMGWNSQHHDRIFEILRDFCAENIYLIGQNGEYAKWGRSLRGEAEVKKIFLWELASRYGFSEYAEPASRRQFEFFLKHGIAPDGKIGRDKAFDNGIWDEYTTCVQAQGYGIYGLAMAYRFASDKNGNTVLPSDERDYVRYLPGADIICGNDSSTGVNYIVPAGNRLTKNMFFWHNRITGENDVEVDVSAKFMPVPYFGVSVPAPYSGPTLPFLPMLKQADGTVLVPRNLDVARSVCGNKVIQKFNYCFPASYQVETDCSVVSTIKCFANRLEFLFEFDRAIPQGVEALVHIFKCTDERVDMQSCFSTPPVSLAEQVCESSIYCKHTVADRFCFAGVSRIEFSLEWKCKA